MKVRKMIKKSIIILPSFVANKDKKKMVILLCCILLIVIFSLLGSTSIVKAEQFQVNEFGFAGGDGSSRHPFLIATPKQLDNVRNYSDNRIIINDNGSVDESDSESENDAEENIETGGNDFKFIEEHTVPGYYFKVICDIDIGDYLAEGGEGYLQNNWGDSGWLPIERFSGVFDGGGFTIKNIWINRPDDRMVGLIGYSIDCKIENIRLELSDRGIRGKNDVGGITGRLHNSFRADKESVIIRHCFVKGNIYSENVAMLKTENNWDIMSNVGGIAGYLFKATVAECEYVGILVGLCSIGGITGISFGGEILDCKVYSNLSLTSTPEYIPIAAAGGIAGTALNGSMVMNCFYKGFKMDDRVAAIVGYRSEINSQGETISAYSKLPEITGCYWDKDFEGQMTFIESKVLNDLISEDGYYFDEASGETLYD